MKKILIVEDNVSFSHHVARALSKEGYACTKAYDGETALRFFQEDTYHIVLLDLNLPGINGLDVCRRMREIQAQVPIIIMTAFSDIDTKLQVFNLGSDDYLVKPFPLQELVAKVRVFIRRSEQTPRRAPLFHLRDIKLDPNRKVAVRDGQDIKLNQKEFDILEYLIKNFNRIISKDELATSLWPEHKTVSHNTIEVYINLLRNKIDRGHDKKLIVTKTGFGYYLDAGQDLL